MADDINTSASFGQKSDDDEEAPIIVAQRFLNIFRQLHIFSEERRQAFNKMLLELPPEVKSIFQSLPGGTPLQEYMEDLEQKSKGLEPVAHHTHQKSGNILQEALAENKPQMTGGEGGIINGDNFARILASSLAQSNAEIIRELQNVRPAPAAASGEVTNLNFDGPMKLVADESFTNIISKALAEAIENSEKKRLEDNQMIARSFTELQENLTKLIAQSSQIQYVAGSGGEAATPLQMKGLVDDLVKAQSAFLQETTKNQKEELSAIIATAIKESQKVSTQALIESFKKINDEKIPTPITYASSSPKGQATMESVEQALKVQGKEFSSIISMALKESQKNSAQTIIETLENLKKDSAPAAGGPNNLKVEEIMRMQANLFRDIARAQNQEFSALISSALKESQKQSTEAIIAALSQLQSLPVQTVAVPVPAQPYVPAPRADFAAEAEPAAQAPAFSPAPVNQQMPLIDQYLDADDDNEDIADIAVEEETPKKKKKNKDAATETVSAATGESPIAATAPATPSSAPDKTPPAVPGETEALPTAPQASAHLAPAAKQENKPLPDEPAAPAAKAEPASPTTAAATNKETATPVAAPAPQKAESPAMPARPAVPAESPAAESSPVQPSPSPKTSSMLEKLLTLSSAFAAESELKDTDSDISNDWGWGTDEPAHSFSDANNSFSSAGGSYEQNSAQGYGEGEDWEWEYEEVPADAAAGNEGEDWEWEYEEVPADAAAGNEGEDWEWEYEEVPADAAAGNEGEDWEWEYEEVPADAAEEPVYAPAPVEDFTMSPEEFVQSSEIVIADLPQFVLMGLEDEKFLDPYVENNDNIR